VAKTEQRTTQEKILIHKGVPTRSRFLNFSTETKSKTKNNDPIILNRFGPFAKHLLRN